MKWLKGVGLLLIANVLIFVTLSITFHVLVNFVLPAFGIDVRGAVSQEDMGENFKFQSSNFREAPGFSLEEPRRSVGVRNCHKESRFES